MDHRHITLAHDADTAGFRSAARVLLAEGIAPDAVTWLVATAQEADLFGPAAQAGEATQGALATEATATAPSPARPDVRITVPSFFVPLCEQAALHADPGRFGLLYRLAWRLVHEPGLRHDPLDADRLQAEQWARAVRRDQHKMTAFVRFRPLAATPDASPQRHVAWFEPVHHIVEATAPFFMRRFTQMHWAILTPQRSVCWDGRALAFGPGARREDAPAPDAGEHLWLTYYAHIFNPARLKLRMMQKEMPRRYWHNLPEASLIQPLVAAAARRTGTMVEAAASTPAHRRPAASLALRIAPPAAGAGAGALRTRPRPGPAPAPPPVPGNAAGPPR